MKIEINLSDIFLEEESSESIQESLKSSIIFEVVNKVKTEYKEQIDRQVREKASKIVGELLTKEHKKSIKKELQTTLIKKETYSDEKISFNDFIKQSIQNSCNGSGYSDIRSEVERIAKNHASELKKRYDLLFASQVVTKLNEKGLLSDKKLMKLLK